MVLPDACSLELFLERDDGDKSTDCSSMSDISTTTLIKQVEGKLKRT